MSLQSNPLTDVKSDDNAVCLGDFYAVPALGQFVYMPAREFWSAPEVNDILPMIPAGHKRNGKPIMLKSAVWLRRYRRVEQITWAPGLPEIIRDKLLSDGGWHAHRGARCLNTYRPPPSILGDAAQATPWIEHMRLLYPEEADEIMDWMAHKVQHPEIKINHALIMGGAPGIGKDWLLQALKLAVGTWNFQETSPTELLDKNNPFAKTVVLRMNEAHDLGEDSRVNRYALYDRTKVYAAAPPDVLACVDKYIRRHYVPNVLGLIVTTNHKDGIYLPPDDRRYLVAWANCTKEDFSKEFWNERWRWLLHEGGAGHVAAFLMQRDLSSFNPYAPPRATAAFYEAVSVSEPMEDAELADVLDDMEKDEKGRPKKDANGQPIRPTIVSILSLMAAPNSAALEWLADRRQRHSIRHRLIRCGYITVQNPDTDDGLWRINGHRQRLYAKIELTTEERLQAAKNYVLQQTKTTGSG